MSENQEENKFKIKKEKKKLEGFTKIFKRIYRGIIYVLAIIGFLSIIWTIAEWKGINIGKKQQEDDPTTRKETSVNVVDFGLKDIGKLVTQTSNSTIVFDNKEDRELFNKIKMPFTESRQLFSYVIKVDAYVDFEKISYEDNGIDEIKIKLPHAQIDDPVINEKSIETYIDKTSSFSKIDLNEQNDSRIKMKEKAVEQAIANGILESADKNAQVMIERIITSEPNHKNYKVTFEYLEEGENENGEEKE